MRSSILYVVQETSIPLFALILPCMTFSGKSVASDVRGGKSMVKNKPKVSNIRS